MPERGPHRRHALARHALAVEHHIGLEHAAAVRAGRHVEAAEVAPLQVGIAIGRGLGAQAGPAGVALQQHGLQRGALHAGATTHAAHGGNAAVQVDDTLAACCRMQAVHVLGD